MQYEVVKYEGRNQHGKPWQGSKGGMQYPWEYLVTLNVNGEDTEVKVVMNAKSHEQEPWCARYLKPGCKLVPRQRNGQDFHEYKGRLELNVDAKATKEIHGDGFDQQGGGSGGGSAPSGGGGGHSQPKGGGYTFEELVALLEQCYGAAAQVCNKEDAQALQACAATLYIAARQEGLKAAVQARVEQAHQAPANEPDWAKQMPPDGDGAGSDADLGIGNEPF